MTRSICVESGTDFTVRTGSTTIPIRIGIHKKQTTTTTTSHGMASMATGVLVTKQQKPSILPCE
jgi:hypothetical protein